MRGAAFRTALAFVVAGLIVAAAVPGSAQEESQESSQPFQNQANPSLLTPQLAVTVVDSKGQEVGPFFPASAYNFANANPWSPGGNFTFVPNLVPREINGVALLFPVSATGFVPTGVELFYKSTNCTGTAYLLEDAGALAVAVGGTTLFLGVYVPFGGPSYSWFSGAGVAGGILYYPVLGTPGSIPLTSVRTINADGTIVPGCGAFATVIGTPQATARPAATLKLSTLGLVPPFHLSW